MVAEAFALPETLAALTAVTEPLSDPSLRGLTGTIPAGLSSLPLQSAAAPGPFATAPSGVKAVAVGVSPAATAVSTAAASGTAASAVAAVASGGNVPGSGLSTGVAGVGPQQLVPEQVADPVRLASLTGMDLLQQLSLLPDRSIAEFVTQHPDAVAKLLASQPSAREVQLWWTALEMDARSAMLVSAPHLVGNLEGVAFGLRDAANRRVLADARRSLSDSAEEGRSKLVDAGNELHMLEQVAEALVTLPGAAPRTLLSFDPVGAGRAAIVIGDLADADYVSFLVPGMFYTADGQIVEWTTAAQSLHDTQTAWIAELAESDPRFAGATTAVVAWIGYQTPGLLNFTSLDLAYQGRDALAAALSGLHALRAEDQPELSVIAHSYGSTAAMMALTDFGIDVDALAVIGSPGTAARHVSELGVAGDNVYVGEAPWDQVKDCAFFGTDPGSSSFGARLFSVDGGVDPITGTTLGGSVGHGEYFVAGSESLRNLALVSLGQGRLVTTEQGPQLAKAVVSASR